MPRAYLEPPALLERVSAAIWAAPARTESTLLVQIPRPDDFEAFARRGFFAFDWRDVHRTHGQSGFYEMQARPAAPSAFEVAAWPAELRPVLRRLQSTSLDFEQAIVGVAEFDCVHPRGAV